MGPKEAAQRYGYDNERPKSYFNGQRWHVAHTSSGPSMDIFHVVDKDKEVRYRVKLDSRTHELVDTEIVTREPVPVTLRVDHSKMEFYSPELEDDELDGLTIRHIEIIEENGDIIDDGYYIGKLSYSEAKQMHTIKMNYAAHILSPIDDARRAAEVSIKHLYRDNPEIYFKHVRTMDTRHEYISGTTDNVENHMRQLNTVRALGR